MLKQVQHDDTFLPLFSKNLESGNTKAAKKHLTKSFFFFGIMLLKLNLQGEIMKKAFTLIELLVVVLIIGILAAIALPEYQKAVEKSYFAQAVIEVRALANAEQLYYLANGTYTTSFNDLDVHFEGEPNAVGNIIQKNWYLSVGNALTMNYVYAGRDKNYLQGRWYILNYLPTDTMYCRALAGDTEAQKICKMFGTAEGCPWDTGDVTCYRLP